MRTRSAVLAATFVSFVPPAAFAAPNVTDFQGKWRIERMVGSSEGGATADYHPLLGKMVDWTATNVRLPGRTCQVVDPKVMQMTNSQLSFVWGGETVDDVSLSRADRAKTFGPSSTPMFVDGGKQCAYGVLVDRTHMLFMFDNGFLYLLNCVSG